VNLKTANLVPYDFIRSKSQVTYLIFSVLYNYNEFNLNNDKSRIFYKYH
jgi:hypothetical protein